MPETDGETVKCRCGKFVIDPIEVEFYEDNQICLSCDKISLTIE